MPFPVYVRAWFLDADEKRGYETFRVDTDLADTLDNMAAVMADVDAINTQLEILSAAAATHQEIVITVDRAYGAPNEFSDLASYAFIRLQDDTTEEPFAHQIPSPDMLLYDANVDGLLDPTFQVAWALMADNIKHPETGNGLDFEYAQKRTRKRWRKLA